MWMRTIAAVLFVSAAAASPALGGADEGAGMGRQVNGGAERAGAAVAAAGQEAALADDGAKALFEAKCSTCHPTSRPLGKTKDEAGWTATVKRMQQVNGCPITDEEAARIIAYLTRIRGHRKAR